MHPQMRAKLEQVEEARWEAAAGEGEVGEVVEVVEAGVGWSEEEGEGQLEVAA